MFDIGGLPTSAVIRRIHLAILSPETPWSRVTKAWEYIGGRHAYNDLYGIMSVSRSLFYRPETGKSLKGIRLTRISPSIGISSTDSPDESAIVFRIQKFAGGLAARSQGDRPAMNSSVETRYPFLNEKWWNTAARFTRSSSCADMAR